MCTVRGFQYTGQAWLPDTGLYHYKTRAYHPALGRFLQPDPIGTAGGMNLYAYVGNDPLNWVDPMGLFPGLNDPPGDEPGEEKVNVPGQSCETRRKNGQISMLSTCPGDPFLNFGSPVTVDDCWRSPIGGNDCNNDGIVDNPPATDPKVFDVGIVSRQGQAAGLDIGIGNNVSSTRDALSREVNNLRQQYSQLCGGR